MPERLVLGVARIFAVADSTTRWGCSGPYYDECRFLELEVNGAQWQALFYDVLRCPPPEPYASGEAVPAYYERNRARFVEALPVFPRLARLWDLMDDTRYTSWEVAALRDECLHLQSAAMPEPARVFVDTILHACDAALACGEGLVFGGS